MVLAFELAPQTLFDGAVAGLAYGMLGVGLVLVYRSSHVINFAYAEIGAFGASVLAMLDLKYGWGYWPALVVGVLAGTLLSAVVELTVIRRLARSPRVVVLIATVGVAQLTLLFRMLLPKVDGFFDFPTAFTYREEIGGVLVRADHITAVVIVPLLTAALALFLSRTLWGTAVRGAAANPEALRLMGIGVRTLSTVVWAIAGAVATLTAIVVTPLFSGTVTGAGATTFDTGLLLVALAAALVGGLRSLPITLLAGIVIGIVKRALVVNFLDRPGLVDLLLLVVILVAVLVRRVGSDDDSSLFLSAGVRAVPAALRRFWWARNLGRLTACVGVAAAFVLPIVVTSASRQFLYSRILVFALLSLSITVLVGWTGQLSLGQFAFAGLGAFSTAALVREGVPFGLAAIGATAVVVVAAMAVGLPALRVRGLMLAVTTLGFAVAMQTYFLKADVFLAGDVSARIGRASLGPIDLTSQRTYYYLCLVVAIVAFAVAGRLRRRGVGRTMLAVRDNEDGAAAASVSPMRTKLVAFALAGALAGLAGALYGGLRVNFGPELFPPELSVSIVAMAVIGGLGSVSGALLGALWVVGLPVLLGDSPEIGLVTSGVGLLVLLMYFPGGLAQLAADARDALLQRLARRVAPPVATGAPARAAVRARSDDGHADTTAIPEVVLRTSDVSVRFGHRIAVDHVSITAGRGEVVGLIGANGAGKSTLMNAIGGFVPSTGAVELLGSDISRCSPAARAARGLGRGFQSATLFPTLTVRECVQVSLERRHRTSITTNLVGLPSATRVERAQHAEADDLIAHLGLGRYAESIIGELSTGTRRITELACLLALGARVLMLDEPTAGVAQRETEALGPLLLEIRRELGATLVLIEHDMPLVLSVSDRVYCLEAGSIIAEGTPTAVRTNPRVVASYLGTDDRAIQRSGAAASRERAPAVLPADS